MITDAHYRHWLEHGYAVVENWLGGDELAEVQEHVLKLLPSRGSIDPGNPGPGVYHRWPFTQGHALNMLAVRDDLLAFVERGIGTRDVVCVKNELIGKYGGTAWSHEQPHHCDYTNNMLVFPRDADGFRQITTLVYFFDVTADLAPTAVVSQQHTAGILPQTGFTREERPELYDREVRVTAPAGSLLIYGMRTFHRGTAMTNPAGFRPSMWHVFQAADVPWRGPQCWDAAASGPDMREAITRMTPRQREVFGFPKVGHAYWNDETIAGVAARYPGMDMSAYQ